MRGFIPHVEAGGVQPHWKLLLSKLPRSDGRAAGKGGPAQVQNNSGLVFPLRGSVLADAAWGLLPRKKLKAGCAHSGPQSPAAIRPSPPSPGARQTSHTSRKGSLMAVNLLSWTKSSNYGDYR